ncbi:MAG: endonuclease/exonuclease/phosphatase family protein [Alphaproteobacteria bacterium]|nr:endonuclease/exonuclease/phosphatase family protein [Alphaproteobacteria bacterium]
MGLVGLAVLVGLGRLDRAPGNLLTGLLFALPYLWLAHAGMVFALWSAVPDRRSLPAALAASLLGALVLWGPGLAAWRAPEGGDTVRVLSWNVQRLWGPGEAEAPACVAATIARAEPDVVALMEVSRANLEALGSLGLECVHTTYRSGGGPGRGGLAVCGRQGWRASGSGRRFVDREDWSYLAAEVRRGTHVFNVLAVHLAPHHFGAPASATEEVAARQANQSRAVVETLQRLHDPTVVAGDFNSTRDFWLHAELRAHLQDVWERGGIGFGATKHVWGWLPLRIDFVYASRDFAVRGADVLGASCSDHRPVLSTLALPR